MKRTALTIWILLHLAGIAAARETVVREIRFEGLKRIREQTLIARSGLSQGKPLPVGWPDSTLKRLQTAMTGLGYYQARIDSIRIRYSKDSTWVRVRVFVHEGRPVRLGGYQFRTDPGVDEETIQMLADAREGDLFRESQIIDDMDRILNYLENNGHPLAEIRFDRAAYDSASARIDIGFHVRPGPEVHISRFLIRGNKLTRTSVIRREIRIRTGALYHHDEVEKIPEDLQRLGFFKRVSPPEIRFTGHEAVVTVRVEEGNPNTFDGVVGYTPSNDPDRPGYFTGQLHLLFRNLFGSGRFFEAFWEKKDRLSQVMRFGYEEPWIRNLPVHAGGYFTQEIRDTTYIDRGWRLRLRMTPRPTLSLSLEGGQREILPDSIGSRIYDLARTRSWVGTLGFEYNTFDEPLNPQKGVRYQTSLTLGRKRNLGPAYMDTLSGWKKTVNTRHLEVNAEFILKLVNRQLLYTGVHGQEVKSGEEFVPDSEQIRFGGTTTQRGYTEDLFRGSQVAWFNLEYRYILGQRSRVFAFLDGGLYQYRDRLKGMVRGQKTCYGFGIRLDTRLGVMGIDYGLGEGDGLMQGKVHVGLINRF